MLPLCCWLTAYAADPGSEPRDAGRDAAGDTLQVVTIGTQSWLVVSRGGAEVSRLRLGKADFASGRTDLRSVVGPNRYETTLTGSGVFGGSAKHTWQLSPLRLLEKSESRHHTAEQTSSSASWSPMSLQGTFSSSDGCGGDELQTRGVLVPQVSVGVGWEEAALGACAARLDSATAEHVTWGAPGEARDAQMSVLAVSERELWVEVRDDVWAEGAESWLYDDHLEVWLARPDAEPCSRTGAVQWGVRLHDGEVFSAHGSPDTGALAVQRTDRGGAVALRLTLPWAAPLTVVYSDSDDGHTQERLLATSRVERGRAGSLGALQLAAPFASCAAEGGVLQVRDTQDPARLQGEAGLSADLKLAR